MSDGIRSGVNWIRANFQRNAEASALTISVLARPGTPTRRAWAPVSPQISSRSIVVVLPDDDLMEARRGSSGPAPVNASTRSRAIAILSSSVAAMMDSSPDQSSLNAYSTGDRRPSSSRESPQGSTIRTMLPAAILRQDRGGCNDGG